MTDLKPCPFCGKPAYIIDAGNDEYVYIQCEDNNDNCLADMGPHNSVEEAIKAWNTRTLEDAPASQPNKRQPECEFCSLWRLQKANYCPNCGKHAAPPEEG
jgi:Lar family restriction alleviation protein